MNLIELNKKVITNKGWLHPNDLAHVSKNHLLQLFFSEIQLASKQVPIRFIQRDELLTMVGVYGIKPGKNIFVGSDNKGYMVYHPASTKLGCFSFRATSVNSFVILVDQDSEFLVEASEANANSFIDEKGNMSIQYQKMSSYLKKVASHANFTEHFLSCLRKHDLLVESTDDLTKYGMQIKIKGLLKIDPERLMKMSEESFVEIRPVLQAIYCIVESEHNWTGLVQISNSIEKRAQDSRKIDRELGQQIFGSADNLSLNFDDLDDFDDSATDLLEKD